MKVLLVDDNFELGLTVKEFLQLKGINVEYVDNGFSAIEKIKENHFDLVILDIIMPGIDGIEVYKEIKKLRKMPKIIFISGYINEERKKEMKELGIKEYLEKPFEFSQLFKKIEELSFEKDKKENTCTFY